MLASDDAGKHRSYHLVLCCCYCRRSSHSLAWGSRVDADTDSTHLCNTRVAAAGCPTQARNCMLVPPHHTTPATLCAGDDYVRPASIRILLHACCNSGLASQQVFSHSRSLSLSVCLSLAPPLPHDGGKTLLATRLLRSHADRIQPCRQLLCGWRCAGVRDWGDGWGWRVVASSGPANCGLLAVCALKRRPIRPRRPL